VLLSALPTSVTYYGAVQHFWSVSPEDFESLCFVRLSPPSVCMFVRGGCVQEPEHASPAADNGGNAGLEHTAMSVSARLPVSLSTASIRAAGCVSGTFGSGPDSSSMGLARYLPHKDGSGAEWEVVASWSRRGYSGWGGMGTRHGGSGSIGGISPARGL